MFNLKLLLKMRIYVNKNVKVGMALPPLRPPRVQSRVKCEMLIAL